MGGKMGKARNIVLWAGLLALGGCNLAGPVLDPSMRGAKVRSCGAVPDALEIGRPVDSGCFAFVRRAATDVTEIAAFLSSAPQCANSFSRATLTMTANGPGAVSLTVFGGTGALPDHRWSWNEGFASRIFHSSGLNGPFITPTGATIRVTGDASRVTDLCFTRY